MAKKDIRFNEDAREQLFIGIEKVAAAVGSTLGPKGQNVIIEKEYGPPIITKDGVTVAKEIDLPDHFQNLGARVLKEASIKTNDLVGDGTTTATVFAHGITKLGLQKIKEGLKPIDLRRGLDLALKQVLAAMKERAIPLKPEDIKRVASISANDEEIGKIIYEILNEMGTDGIIAVEEGRSSEIEKEIVKGVRFDKGYISPYMVTDPSKMISDLSDVPVFITDMKFMAAVDIARIMEKIAQNGGRELVLVAEDVTNDALATALENKLRGNFLVLAIKAPNFGETKVEMLKDLAALSGARFFSSEEGRKFDSIELEEFGKFHKVIAEREQTTFVDGAGKAEDIEARVNDIKIQLEKTESKFDKERLEERLAKLTGGVAVIRVGAATDVDMREKKQRVEDAVAATRAAASEGIVPGGGVIFLNVRNAIKLQKDSMKDGMMILHDVLLEPTRLIVKNAGANDEKILVELLKEDSASNKGFDASDGVFKDLIASGVIDPVKVSRTALENAVSIAGVFLTTACAITVLPEDPQVKSIK